VSSSDRAKQKRHAQQVAVYAANLKFPVTKKGIEM